MLSIIRCKFYFCQKLYSGGTEFLFYDCYSFIFSLSKSFESICFYGFPNYLQLYDVLYYLQ